MFCASWFFLLKLDGEYVWIAGRKHHVHYVGWKFSLRWKWRPKFNMNYFGTCSGIVFIRLDCSPTWDLLLLTWFRGVNRDFWPVIGVGHWCLVAGLNSPSTCGFKFPWFGRMTIPLLKLLLNVLPFGSYRTCLLDCVSTCGRPRFLIIAFSVSQRRNGLDRSSCFQEIVFNHVSYVSHSYSQVSGLISEVHNISAFHLWS